MLKRNKKPTTMPHPFLAFDTRVLILYRTVKIVITVKPDHFYKFQKRQVNVLTK